MEKRPRVIDAEFVDVTDERIDWRAGLAALAYLVSFACFFGLMGLGAWKLTELVAAAWPG